MEIFGILGVVIVGLMAALGFKNHQVKELKQENKGFTKKIKTQEVMKATEIKLEAKEDEAIKDFDDSNWRDNI